LIIILSACNAQTLNSSQTFGLFATKGEPLELLQLETKGTAEGPYTEIQYTFLYRNPNNNTIQTKFMFPTTENAVFHKFEATIQNQTLAAKIINTPANDTQNPQASHNSEDSLSIPADQTVQIIFSMIQPLKTYFDLFYELTIPAFLNSSHPSLQHWNVQIEVRSIDREISIFHNPTHDLTPEHSFYHLGSRIFWNATIPPNQDFTVYFGPSENESPQVILAAHPQDPNDQVLLLNSIPDRDYGNLNTRFIQETLQNKTSNGLLRIKDIVLKDYMWEYGKACLFVIDRGDSMKGSKIESLKSKLKTLISDFAPYCYDYDILSFGRTFELYGDRYDSDTHNINMTIEWIDNLEADMGESDLLKTLQYIRSWGYKFWYKYRGGGTGIILTGEDISNSLEVIQAMRQFSAIVTIGNDTSKDIIKSLTNTDGTQIKIVLENENLEDKILDLLEASYTRLKYYFGLSLTCWDSEYGLVYKLENDPNHDDFLRKWVYLPNKTEIVFCDGKIEIVRIDFSSYGHRHEINTSQFKKTENTDIWHKIAYDSKIKELLQENSNTTQEKIMNLSLHYQISSPFTSLVLQISGEAIYSSDFFDLSNFNKQPSQPPVNIVNIDQKDTIIPKNDVPDVPIEYGVKYYAHFIGCLIGLYFEIFANIFVKFFF